MKNLSCTKKKHKRILIALLLVLMMGVLVACGGNNDTDTPDATPAPQDTTNQDQADNNVDTNDNDADADVADDAHAYMLPFDTVGHLTIMTWGSSPVFLEDIGRVEQTEEDLHDTHMGNQFMAVAQAFNEIFPYIQIDYNGQGPEWLDGMPFYQHRDNFTMMSGRPVDIFWTSDLPAEISRGAVADLTVFSDDPRFQMLNPTLMDMMNIEGRQFGLPWAAAPAGVWVNRALAEMNNIDVPPANWTWNQYLDFVTNYSADEWYGTWWVGIDSLVPTLTPDFHYQLRNRGPNDPFVNINSPAIRGILSDITRKATTSGQGLNQQEQVSQEFMDAGGWSWQNGMALTGLRNAWLYGSAWTTPGGVATSENPGGFDVFPNPSTPYMPNHVGLEMDIIAVRNFALDDGDPYTLTDEQFLQMRIAWEFLIFAIADARSLEARINQEFIAADGNWRSTKDHSVPLITGPEFDRQMARIFETPGWVMMADRNMYPGFHMILDLFRDGYIVGTQFRDIPGTHEFEGEIRNIFWEWNAMQGGYSLGGIRFTDPGWLDAVLAHLPEFNDVMNQRWAERHELMSEHIARFYPIPTQRP